MRLLGKEDITDYKLFFSKTLCLPSVYVGVMGVLQGIFTFLAFLLGLAGLFLFPLILMFILASFGMVMNNLTISLILLPGLLASILAIVWFGEEWDLEVN